MIFPNLEGVEQKINSKYLLAILVAKRARQIKEDSPRLAGLSQPHPITLALRELLEHEIKIVLDDPTLGIKLCDETIDVDELRREAQEAYVALSGIGPRAVAQVEMDESEDASGLGELELTEEAGVAGLDELGEETSIGLGDGEDL